MKFLRVARLDDTDEYVYSRAAQVGELAVPGTFAFTFSEYDPAMLEGKEKQAFRHAFLGTGSFGWATVAVVAEITEAEYKGVIEALAHHFIEHYGAPSLEEALPVARAEAEYAAGLCEHEVNTLISVERTIDAQGIHESFKVITQRVNWDAENTRIWQFAPDDSRDD
ncbi:MAG TPA: DUF6505 family protein [Gammaproteobacteria bacterium]|nr:DUF6505 family protein [Gammaproteobacteria bacterium]